MSFPPSRFVTRPVTRTATRRLTRVGYGVLGLIFSMAAAAQTAPAPASVMTLREAAQNAVLNNPDVLAKWHTIRAADGERDAAFGALLPRVDLSVSGGRERRDDTTFRGNLNRSANSVAISQLLYDGFATRNEVRRLDHARLVRLYEFLDTSETVAFEATRAYLDVLRYRELVRLAEDNYVQHRAVFAQTERRVKAKVARGVDLEQISARLASAESNLLLETGSLHDTSARFQRIVGLLPAADMPVPAQLTVALPADPVAALQQAQQRNGALLAAVENIRAASSALDSRSGAYGPRVDLRLRRDRGNNMSGTIGTLDSNVAEIVLNWNLFSGGADRARDRQFANQLNLAKDQRDKTCRDIRQTLLIALNDVRKIKEQLAYLDQSKVSLEKARNAYRQQFDIGQRTLLDLLDTENELYQSRRTVANAEQDLNLAYVRVQAALGTLLTSLDLSRIDVGALPGVQTGDGADDVSKQCPPDAIAVYTVDKDALNERANEQIKQTAILNARERAQQETAQEARRQQEADATTTPPRAGAPVPKLRAPVVPAAPSPAAPTPAPSAPAAPSVPSVSPAPVRPQPSSSLTPSDVVVQASGDATADNARPVSASSPELLSALEAWRTAWVQRDIDKYLVAYAPGQSPSPLNRKVWEQNLRNSFSRISNVQVDINDIQVTANDPTHATMVFTQGYRSPRYQDVVTKTLRWEQIDGRWLIVREGSVPQATGSSVQTLNDAGANNATLTLSSVPVAPSAAAATAARGAEAIPSSATTPELTGALEAWRSAWVKRDVESYLAIYAPGQAPSGSGDRKVWEENRRALIGRASEVWIDVADVTVEMTDATHAATVFKQTYRSSTYQDVVTKTLRWEQIDGRWLIVREASAKWTSPDDKVASSQR